MPGTHNKSNVNHVRRPVSHLCTQGSSSGYDYGLPITKIILRHSHQQQSPLSKGTCTRARVCLPARYQRRSHQVSLSRQVVRDEVINTATCALFPAAALPVAASSWSQSTSEILTESVSGVCANSSVARGIVGASSSEREALHRGRLVADERSEFSSNQPRDASEVSQKSRPRVEDKYDCVCDISDQHASTKHAAIEAFATYRLLCRCIVARWL
jgi:hypothetical protein